MTDPARIDRLRERYRRALRSSYALLSPRKWMRRLVFWGGAIAVGFVATVFAIAGFYADGTRRPYNRHMR